MERRTLTICPTSREQCLKAVSEAPDGTLLTLRKNTRSLAQNALMWAVLTQLTPIDWYGNHLTKEEWKDVITASLKQQKVVPGIDGGFVVCGDHTSRMTIPEMNDVIELAYSVGSQHGIRFIDRFERSAA